MARAARLLVLLAAACAAPPAALGSDATDAADTTTLHPDEITTEPATTPELTDTTAEADVATTLDPSAIDAGAGAGGDGAASSDGDGERWPGHRVGQLLAAGSYSKAGTVTVSREMGHPPTSVLVVEYLAMRGLADLPVLMLEAARHPYRAVYYGRADFQRVKPSLPFGRVPILRVPGTETEPGAVVAQSPSIVRYLASRLGVDGGPRVRDTRQANVKTAEVSMWYETVRELFGHHSRWGSTFNASALQDGVAAADADAGASLHSGLTFRDTTNGGVYSAAARSLMVLQTFEEAVTPNRTVHFLATDHITYADLALWCELDKLDEAWPGWATLGGARWHRGFPGLRAYKRSVEHDGGLAEYLLSDRRMPRVERRDDGDYHYLQSRRPVKADDDGDRGNKGKDACCQGLTADCLACRHGVSVATLCQTTSVAGCPTVAHTGEL